jgi:hypothetical protein
MYECPRCGRENVSHELSFAVECDGCGQTASVAFDAYLGSALHIAAERAPTVAEGAPWLTPPQRRMLAGSHGIALHAATDGAEGFEDGAVCPGCGLKAAFVLPSGVLFCRGCTLLVAGWPSGEVSDAHLLVSEDVLSLSLDGSEGIPSMEPPLPVAPVRSELGVEDEEIVLGSFEPDLTLTLEDVRAEAESEAEAVTETEA